MSRKKKEKKERKKEKEYADLRQRNIFFFLSFFKNLGGISPRTGNLENIF